MQAVKHQTVIALLGVTLFFTNLGKPKLWDRDEPRNARCAVEMMQRHDWTVPTFNGELRTHKPVLLYWLMMSAYCVFGVNEFAARFWSAAFAVGTVLLTYSIGRRLLNRRAGLWAAIILSTTLMFNVSARAATPDSALIFFMTLALALYVRTSFRDQQGRALIFGWSTLPAENTSDQTYYPKRLFAIPIYAAMGVAVLAKGPIGIVIPTAVIGLFLAIIRLSDQCGEIQQASNSVGEVFKTLVRPLSPLHLVRTAWSMRPITALISALAVALPWYLLVGIETDGKWIQSFFLDHNIGRASTAMEGHAGSTLFYYPLAIVVGLCPWSILAAPVCLDAWHVIRQRKGWSTSYTFLLCWIGVFVGIFSLVQTKLPSYVTPAYPALALLIAACVERMISGESAVKTHWFKAAAASLTAVGAIGSVAVLYAARVYLPGEEWLALIGVIPLTLGIPAFLFASRQMPGRFASALAITAMAISLAVFGVALPRISNRQQITDLLDTAQSTEFPTQLASFAVHEPSWVFYASEEVPFLTADRESEAIDFLRHSDTALITTKSEYDRIRRRLPNGTSRIAETEYFLKDDVLVLVGRPKHFANVSSAAMQNEVRR